MRTGLILCLFLYFVGIALAHYSCGTEFKLPPPEKRAADHQCSPDSACSYVCGSFVRSTDDPFWRDAYGLALEEGRLDDLILESNVYTWAAPDSFAADFPVRPNHATAQETEETQVYMNNVYEAAGISFNFTYHAIKDNLWASRVSDIWKSCLGPYIMDNERHAACIDAAWDGGSFFCSATESATACGSCNMPVECMATPLNAACRDAITNLDSTCECVCFGAGADPGTWPQHAGLTLCPTSYIGDGICDAECNFGRYSWDGGDCCLPSEVKNGAMCWNATSPLRGWIGDLEMKATFVATSSSAISQYIVNIHSSWSIGGIATFPWDELALSPFGGIINRAGLAWGTSNPNSDSMIAAHEMGHALGLWHTHHGVSEVWCDDPCYEVQPETAMGNSSDYTGDLCSDTRPTPTNYFCGDPVSGARDCRTNNTWVNTPFENTMSYAFMNCTAGSVGFTLQQRARMRCYIDCSLRPWRTSAQKLLPTTIVHAPEAYHTDSHGIRVTWREPVGKHGASDYQVERNPAFNNTQYRNTSGAFTEYLDTDYEAGSAFVNTTVKYRVKKVDANFWSPWSIGTLAYIRGPILAPIPEPISEPPVRAPAGMPVSAVSPLQVSFITLAFAMIASVVMAL